MVKVRENIPEYSKSHIWQSEKPLEGGKHLWCQNVLVLSWTKWTKGAKRVDTIHWWVVSFFFIISYSFLFHVRLSWIDPVLRSFKYRFIYPFYQFWIFVTSVLSTWKMLEFGANFIIHMKLYMKFQLLWHKLCLQTTTES